MNEALKRVLIHHNIAPAKRQALVDDIFGVLDMHYGQDWLGEYLVKHGFIRPSDWEAA